MTLDEQITLLIERLVKGELTIEKHDLILKVIKKNASNQPQPVKNNEPQPETEARDITTEKPTSRSNEKSFKQLSKYSGIQLGIIQARPTRSQLHAPTSASRFKCRVGIQSLSDGNLRH
jgi:hypothetical protein